MRYLVAGPENPAQRLVQFMPIGTTAGRLWVSVELFESATLMNQCSMITLC